MDNKWKWKSLSLCREISVSGSFIYNGLKAFDEIRSFTEEDKVFEFLYNIAVGIERLEKIAIILIEHNAIEDQEAFEKSLITHNHCELLNRIKNFHTLNFASMHNSFLQLLANFYKTTRYGRYTLKNLQSNSEENEILKEFICKHMEIEFKENQAYNTTKIKRFMGKVVGKIASELFDIVKRKSYENETYTYELRYDSKAAKVFLRATKDPIDFSSEDIVWKELLIFFMKTPCKERVLRFIKEEVEPLSLDTGRVDEYLECFKNNIKRFDVADEISYIYSELKEDDKNFIKNRLKLLSLIGDPGVNWDAFYDDGEFEFD